MKHKKEKWVWVLNQGKVFEWDKDGRPLRMAGTHLDITERKRVEGELRKYRQHLEELVETRTTELIKVNRNLEAEIIERNRAEDQLKDSLAEKEVLLKEVHHRVKNNLQLINSLLNLQSERIRDKESLAVFEECKNRVNSIALVHEKLYESNNLANINFGEYVRTLTAQLFDSFPTRPSIIRLKMDVADVFLEVSKAISCALVINELVTNAIKYGFPKDLNREGEVKIELIPTDEGTVTLIVADNGVGLPDNFDISSSKTLGMQIIKALVKKLHGSIAVDRSEGAKFSVEFPINQ